MSEHTCHAYKCGRRVDPAMVMCTRHWFMVPKRLRDIIWRTYRRGQEITKDPSHEYMVAQRGAVWAVFVLEGGCGWPDVPEVESEAFMIGPACMEKTEK